MVNSAGFVRQFLATAAAGIAIGAAIMICVPVEVMSMAGLDHPDQSIAVHTAILAAAISAETAITAISTRLGIFTVRQAPLPA